MLSTSSPAFRFGKLPPKQDYRTLRLKDYLTPEIAPPPPSVDVLATVYAKLGETDPAGLFPMDGNNTYGDCTIAAVAHAITTYRGLLGTKVVMPEKAVTKLYFHLTGGADGGLQELDVLDHWRKTAISHDKILAYVKIDHANHTHVQQAIQLFGGVYLGFQVQQDCNQEFLDGEPWTPGPLTNDGHAVFAVGYDQDELTVLTWGNTQQATWGWWDECVDEAYAILPPEAKDPAFAPGFDIDKLMEDLNAVAS